MRDFLAHLERRWARGRAGRRAGARPPAAGSACLHRVRSLPDGAGECGLTPPRENRTTVFPVPRLQSPGPAHPPVLNTKGARNGELGCRKSSRPRGRRWGRRRWPTGPTWLPEAHSRTRLRMPAAPVLTSAVTAPARSLPVGCLQDPPHRQPARPLKP